MSIDLQTGLTIIAMAVVTYATRIGGLALQDRLKVGPRARAALDAIPPVVLVAVIAPSLLATGWRETAASAVTIVAATRLPLIATVAVGIMIIVALRHLST
jgi:uncharacterized membrane protein